MSLAELIISMGLAMLLIGSAMVKSDIGYLKIDQTARQLCSDIRYVKMKSVSGERRYSIKLTKINNQDVYQVWGSGGLEKTVKLNKGMRIMSSINIIKFRPDATPERGCTLSISYKSRKKIITITPISGRVLLKEDIYRE